MTFKLSKKQEGRGRPPQLSKHAEEYLTSLKVALTRARTALKEAIETGTGSHIFFDNLALKGIEERRKHIGNLSDADIDEVHMRFARVILKLANEFPGTEAQLINIATALMNQVMFIASDEKDLENYLN